MNRPTRWQDLKRGSATEYAARFSALADSGADVHGEASVVTALVAAPARILDAGCGTGRVALRLQELGYQCLGVDADSAMLAEALALQLRRQSAAPGSLWALGDISDLSSWQVITAASDQDRSRDQTESLREWVRTGADLIVLAGNVIPLLAPGTLAATMASMSGLLRPAGLIVAGFGLDARHLPAGCPVTTLEEFDVAAASAGLVIRERCSTWSAGAFRPPGSESSPADEVPDEEMPAAEGPAEYAVTVLTRR